MAKTPILVFDIVAFAGRQINYVIDNMRDNETAHDDRRSNETLG